MSRIGGAAFSLSGVEVWRDDRAVLRVPSLEIPEGDALALVGPNGAGKSTLLQVLAGLLVPAAGEVRVDSARASDLDARRKVALVPQDAPMLRGSVRHNVELPLKLRGVSRSLTRERAARALERAGVASLAERNASELSGGEARRVAIARALSTDPAALLLDEPFSGLDAPARDALVADLKSVLREHGRTLVLVTQVRDEALRLGSRFGVVWNGELRQVGKPEEVLSRPAAADVARFLGIGNVLHARVLSHEAGGLVAEIGALRVVAAPPAPLPAVGAEVWLVFGPEQVELRREPSETSARNAFRARIVEIEPREGRHEVRLDASGVPLVSAVTRAAVERLRLVSGVEVEAVVKATAVHVVPV